MSHYVGRFAPSPTGHLHAGSLACLLASYLDARAHRGTWIIRVEDIDPPREPAWAAEDQLETIEAFKLHSDRPILRQSTRYDAYQEALDLLIGKGLAYGCACTRKSLKLPAQPQVCHRASIQELVATERAEPQFVRGVFL